MKDLRPNFVQIVQLTDGNLAAFNGTVTENDEVKARVQRLVLRLASVHLDRPEVVSTDDIQQLT